MEKKKLQRINQLTAISRQRPLTPEETAERAQLRAEYRASVCRNLEEQLDHMAIQYPDGHKEFVKDKKKF